MEGLGSTALAELFPSFGVLAQPIISARIFQINGKPKFSFLTLQADRKTLVTLARMPLAANLYLQHHQEYTSGSTWKLQTKRNGAIVTDSTSISSAAELIDAAVEVVGAGSDCLDAWYALCRTDAGQSKKQTTVSIDIKLPSGVPVRQKGAPVDPENISILMYLLDSLFADIICDRLLASTVQFFSLHLISANRVSLNLRINDKSKLKQVQSMLEWNLLLLGISFNKMGPGFAQVEDTLKRVSILDCNLAPQNEGKGKKTPLSLTLIEASAQSESAKILHQNEATKISHQNEALAQGETAKMKQEMVQREATVQPSPPIDNTGISDSQVAEALGKLSIEDEAVFVASWQFYCCKNDILHPVHQQTLSDFSSLEDLYRKEAVRWSFSRLFYVNILHSDKLIVGSYRKLTAVIGGDHVKLLNVWHLLLRQVSACVGIAAVEMSKTRKFFEAQFVLWLADGAVEQEIRRQIKIIEWA